MGKKLIFIPYQDSDTFYSSGILTREYAMLYMLCGLGIKDVINIKKPRTFLDRKRFEIVDENFPCESIEAKVKEKLDKSITLQKISFLDFDQIRRKRAWWINGYTDTIHLLEKLNIDYQKCVVYSNNPFACNLIEYLKCKGAKIYFDAMDNLTIHPSLNDIEHRAAFDGYKKTIEYADCTSANSEQTCSFLKYNFGRDVLLVKNGVFIENKSAGVKNLKQYLTLMETKKKYKNSIGYIGKIGLRIDADLVDNVSKACPNSLFVFIGPYLKGQANSKLYYLFENRKNILYLEEISSAHVFGMLDELDILTIPHAVGKAENGGDPLKLYQYLTRKKPIMTTKILGVDEFSEHIFISNNSNEWIEYINAMPLKINEINLKDFTWETRFSQVKREMKRWI